MEHEFHSVLNCIVVFSLYDYFHLCLRRQMFFYYYYFIGDLTYLHISSYRVLECTSWRNQDKLGKNMPQPNCFFSFPVLCFTRRKRNSSKILTGSWNQTWIKLKDVTCSRLSIKTGYSTSFTIPGCPSRESGLGIFT